MPISKSKHMANEKYNSKAYDEIKVRVPKGQKELIQSAAESGGESVNGFITRLIMAEIECKELKPSKMTEVTEESRRKIKERLEAELRHELKSILDGTHY